MQDTITSIINSADIQGKYLDGGAIETLQSYFQSGSLRVRIADQISAHSAEIVKEGVAQLRQTEAQLDSASMQYSSHSYAACIRDMDYFLRYATYAMLADNPSILDERVINGLKETYLTLGVSIDTTIRALQAMKTVTATVVGEKAGQEMGYYFDYICDALS